ncbi:MAG TPA: SLC13 family permease [Gemmatimonadaceae bacterium]|nr:SLC13 family permease [Gemmatimonadaceae bacterium]
MGAHPPDSPAILAIFALTYAGIAVGHVPGLKLDRTGIALLGAIAVVVISGMPTTAAVGFVNWPTILLLFGFFVLSAQLRLSGFFDKIAGAVAGQLDDPGRFLFLLMVVTAAMSAVLNHDIVCVVFAPVVGAALLKRRLDPVPFLVALAIAGNIGAASTLVGNPQDMMIAQVAGLSFGRYALWCSVPVLFALGSSYALIWALSRRRLSTTGTTIGPTTAPSTTAATEPTTTAATVPPAAHAMLAPHPYDRVHTIKGLVILGLAIGFFFTNVPKEVVAMAAAGIHLASNKFNTDDLLGLVDWPILVLFTGLFVVTGAFQATGYGDQAVHWLAHLGVDLQSPPTLAIVTAALSNLINNSAAVLLLVKVANVTRAPSAYVLALANSFGGSLIILGSVSNIIVVNQAREMGINISFRAFARLGIPVTVVSMLGLLGWVALMT